MANIISIISRNTMPGRKRVRPFDPDIFMVRVDAEPGAGLGTEAPVGSFGVYEPFGGGLEVYYKFGPLDTEWRIFLDQDGILAAAGADERVKVTSNDAASGFLLDKLTTITPAVSFTEINDAGNEDLQIDVANATETTPGLIEIATQAEVNAGSSTTLAVTPAYLSNTTLEFTPKSPTIVEITGTSYTVLPGDDIVLVNQSADSAVTITLPSGASHETGFITIKDKKGTASTRTLTIAADGAETIDGQPTHDITVDYRARQLVFFGTEWSIV